MPAENVKSIIGAIENLLGGKDEMTFNFLLADSEGKKIQEGELFIDKGSEGRTKFSIRTIYAQEEGRIDVASFVVDGESIKNSDDPSAKLTKRQVQKIKRVVAKVNESFKSDLADVLQDVDAVSSSEDEELSEEFEDLNIEGGDIEAQLAGGLSDGEDGDYVILDESVVVLDGGSTSRPASADAANAILEGAAAFSPRSGAPLDSRSQTQSPILPA